MLLKLAIMNLRKLTLITLTLFCETAFAQIGKDGARTISAANTIVNEYTTLTADAASGATTLTVASSSLNANGRFSGPLAQGDLIMIIQMQGATINASAISIWSIPNDATWGGVTAYNNCGNYELAQVNTVPTGTSITIFCGLRYNYTASGRVQVIRVPRYTTLTVNNSLTGQTWNGTTGGIVSVEVQGLTTVGAAGSFVTNGLGFRGGAVSEDVDVYGGTAWGSSSNGEGAPKGEGIAGFTPEYIPLNAEFCRGAPANGGGGGDAHNSGGGGGSNAGNLLTYTGFGVPNPAYNAIWNLETPALGGTSSSGGGRGGNSYSSSNQNAAVVVPGNASWGGDNNRNVGGNGGWPLDYSTGKIFIGGGGGSGDQNDGDGGPGASGGGLVFITSYNSVSGTGVINANGNAGTSSLNAGFPLSGYAGKDAAGGGGGGGTVIINANGTVSGIVINANGGKGGDQNFPVGGIGNDAYGPGGGGSGGYIAISAGAPTRNANGGANGTSNSNGFTEFPPKGATSGGVGLPNQIFSNYYFTLSNVTICSGTGTTLTAAITGTVPAGVTLNWYASQFSTVSLGTGSTFTTPALGATTTYYVGFCPGWYRLPVTVTISPAIVINTSSMSITNATCGASNGSISGITVSGGTGALTYTWNGTASASPNLSGAAAGSYTLVVTDAAGCTASSGPHSISNTASPTINTSAMVITNATCGMSNGSITGITASGGTGALTYRWNGVLYPSANLTSAPAGSYTLVVTDAAGCTATAGPFTISNVGGVTINTAAMVNTSSTCGGANGSITGITATSSAGGLTYSWNGTSYPSANLPSTSAGSYTLTVTDAAGCTATAGPFTISNVGGVTINTAAMVNTSSTCGGANGSITGITATSSAGGLTYSWNGTSYPSANLPSTSAGSYTLTVTDAAGCTAAAGPFTITNSGGVTINVSSLLISDATCGSSNGSITGITASSTAGGLTYTWNGSPSATPDITLIPGGAYTLVATDAVGCTAAAGPFTVNNVGGPTINVSSSSVSNTTCGLNNGSISGITATGTGTLTYDWNGTPSTGTNLLNASSGSYILTVTDGSGCTQVAGPFTINSSTNVVANVSGTNVTCFGLTDGSATAGATGASGTYNYSWMGGPTTSTYSSLGVGTYTVIVTSTDGCIDTISVNITEPASIAPSISGTTSVCNGSSTTLTATGGGSYLWSNGDTTSAITVTPVTSGIISVDVTVGACTETATTNITVNSMPIAVLTGNGNICLGQSTVLTAGGGLTYLWNNGSTSSTLTVSPLVNSNYFVIVTNACGSDTAFFSVTVGAAFSVNAGADVTIPLGGNTILSATSASTFSWTPTTGLSCTNCQNPVASPTTTTSYIVTATSPSGCTASDTVTVIVDVNIVLFVPDIFAPNGNVVNDLLFVRGTGIDHFIFKVYDRWGQKVWETSSLSEGWDGSFGGKPLDTGVFVYTLDGAFVTGEAFKQKGNVTLKR